MTQDKGQHDLDALDGAISRLISELEKPNLPFDDRQRLEDELAALIDLRLAVGKKGRRTSN